MNTIKRNQKEQTGRGSDDVMIRAEGVSKKFSRTTKHIMLYGGMDIMRDFLGARNKTHELRPGEFWALEDVSFELKRGETLGVIGQNGSGKSTLLSLLSGIYMPDKGRVKVKGRVAPLIQVGAGFHPMLTGRENIYINGQILGMTKKEIDEKFDSIVEFAEIGEFLDSPVKHYSSGMYVRLGFAVAVHCEPDILLVDEVLAVGDINFRAKCFNAIGVLRNNDVSIILVTHDMVQVSMFCSQVLLLENGKCDYMGESNSGIKKYKNDTLKKAVNNISSSRISNGSDSIKFENVYFNGKQSEEEIELFPFDDLEIEIEYKSKISIKHVDVNISIISTVNTTKPFYQATNKAYDKKISIKKGFGRIRIYIKEMNLNNSLAHLNLSVWGNHKKNLLLWIKNVQLKFRDTPFSEGYSHFRAEYYIK